MCETEKRREWSREKTLELIEMYKSSPVLWDSDHELYRKREKKEEVKAALAATFNTTAQEITRKLHNLRTQFNCELRKQALRKSDSTKEDGKLQSNWEYFDYFDFLYDEIFKDANLSPSCAEKLMPPRLWRRKKVFQKVLKKRSSTPICTSPAPLLAPSTSNFDTNSQKRSRIENDLLSNAVSMLNRPPDDCQIFGDFVAASLRDLQSDASRRKLKRKIQMAVLQAQESDEEEVTLCKVENDSTIEEPG